MVEQDERDFCIFVNRILYWIDLVDINIYTMITVTPNRIVHAY